MEASSPAPEGPPPDAGSKDDPAKDADATAKPKSKGSLRERVARDREIARLKRNELMMTRIPLVGAIVLVICGVLYLARMPIYRVVARSDSDLGRWAVGQLAEARDPGSFALYVEQLGRDADRQAFNQLVYLGAGRTTIAEAGATPGPDDADAVAAHQQTLSDGLASDQPDRRRGALYAMWTLEDRDWTRTEALLTRVARLLDPPCDDTVARRYAALVLKVSPAPKALHDAILRAALQDDDRQVRRHAVEAAGNTGDPTLGDRLVPAMEDQFAEVRRQATLSLSALGVEVPLATLLDIYDADNDAMRAEVLEVIAGRDGPEVLDALIHGLRSATAATRSVAVNGLATRPSARAREGLESALRDTNDHVRLSAIEALGEREDGQASVPKLIAALRGHQGWQEVKRLHAALRELTGHEVPPPTPLEASWQPVIEAWEAYGNGAGQ